MNNNQAATTAGAGKRRPTFGQIYQVVSAVLNGPDSLFPGELDEPGFFGIRLLTLEMRYPPQVPAQHIESRSVYANRASPEMTQAIVRATAWDRRLARRRYHEDGLILPVRISARFVEIGVEEVAPWLDVFIGQHITVDDRFEEDAPIRRVRIEFSQGFSAYECLWQNNSSELRALNDAFAWTWGELTKVLQRAPQVHSLTENFNFPARDQYIYDFEDYNPTYLRIEASERIT